MVIRIFRGKDFVALLSVDISSSFVARFCGGGFNFTQQGIEEIIPMTQEECKEVLMEIHSGLFHKSQFVDVRL